MTRRTFVPRANEDSPTQADFDTNQRAVEELQNLDILDGHLLEGVSISSDGTSVAHGLDRTFRGWFLTRKPVGIVIEEQAAQSDAGTVLDLQIHSDTITTNAGEFSLADASATLVTTGNGRVNSDLGGAPVIALFPGPLTSALTGATVYGENPGASVRTIDGITLERTTDQHANSLVVVSTLPAPATTISLEWSSSIPTADVPFVIPTGERIHLRVDPAAGGGTNVIIYSVEWTFAPASTAEVDIWVF